IRGQMIAETRVETSTETEPTAVRSYLRRLALFLLIGLGLYLALYGASEALVYRYGLRNPFYVISATPAAEYDLVILGASHAMPLGYEDMNDRLEAATGARIVNLAMEGSGVLPNTLVLDYFLSKHTVGNVVYVVDSFAF